MTQMHGRPSSNLRTEIEQLVAEHEEHLIALRRDIHANPETGFDTFRTAALVASELSLLGLSPRTGVGRTGVVAEIVGGAPGPCVLLRADMDALPLTEQTGLPYASVIPGKMHACGHDLHTAALIGAASALTQMAGQMKGSVRLVFQPAEETQESGAAAMIADGAAAGVDFAIAFHNQPQIADGVIVLNRGASTASSDEFRVTVTGRSGHAARPHESADPIIAAAYLITQLQTVVSREMDPGRSAVLTVGHIDGGFTQNIIPESCMFEGTVRCRSASSRDRAEAAFRRICGGVAMALNVAVEIEYVRGAPALENNDTLVDLAATAFTDQFGSPPVIDTAANFGAEDFSYFSERIPSIQIYIGSSQPNRCDRVHNSDYQPNESCIKNSAIALTRVAMEILSQSNSPTGMKQGSVRLCR